MTVPEKLRPLIEKLYAEDRHDSQFDRYKKLEQKFIHIFGRGEGTFFSTPGRVELGGNHTDHNNGKVLAASIDLDSIAIASLAHDKVITIYSDGYEKPFVVKLDNLEKHHDEQGTTTALIRGIAARMAELGYEIAGFNACNPDLSL